MNDTRAGYVQYMCIDTSMHNPPPPKKKTKKEKKRKNRKNKSNIDTHHCLFFIFGRTPPNLDSYIILYGSYLCYWVVIQHEIPLSKTILPYYKPSPLSPTLTCPILILFHMCFVGQGTGKLNVGAGDDDSRGCEAFSFFYFFPF